jgi:hypothetical protein
MQLQNQSDRNYKVNCGSLLVPSVLLGEALGEGSIPPTRMAPFFLPF